MVGTAYTMEIAITCTENGEKEAPFGGMGLGSLCTESLLTMLSPMTAFWHSLRSWSSGLLSFFTRQAQWPRSAEPAMLTVSFPLASSPSVALTDAKWRGLGAAPVHELFSFAASKNLLLQHLCGHFDRTFRFAKGPLAVSAALVSVINARGFLEVTALETANWI